jgi:N-acetylglucosamine-6-phosphate deacetylase
MKTIDLHIHGISGYDTRTTEPNHIIKIAEIEGDAGVSEIVLTIYPAPINVMRENISIAKKAMEIQKSISESQKFAKIIGVHLEGPFLNPSRCGALNAIAFIEPDERNLNHLIEGFEDIIKIISIAPELKGATKLIKKMADLGIKVNMGHSDATFSEAEAGFKAGAKGITHIFNAMRGFHHREPGLAGFGLLNQDIFIEVIADPYHLHHEMLKLIFKTKRSDRIIIVSDSVKETKISSVRGVFDNKGILLGGSETIIESSKRLIDMGFDDEKIIRCITENPERYLA